MGTVIRIFDYSKLRGYSTLAVADFLNCLPKVNLILFISYINYILFIKHNCNTLDTFLCLCASRSVNLQAARTLKEMATNRSEVWKYFDQIGEGNVLEQRLLRQPLLQRSLFHGGLDCKSPPHPPIPRARRYAHFFEQEWVKQSVGLCVMLTGNVLDILYFRLTHNIYFYGCCSVICASCVMRGRPMRCKWSSVDIQAHQYLYFLLLCSSYLNLFSLCLKFTWI